MHHNTIHYRLKTKTKTQVTPQQLEFEPKLKMACVLFKEAKLFGGIVQERSSSGRR